MCLSDKIVHNLAQGFQGSSHTFRRYGLFVSYIIPKFPMLRKKSKTLLKTSAFRPVSKLSFGKVHQIFSA